MRSQNSLFHLSDINTRGVSETLGVILLLGMITIGASSLAVAGSDMINSLQNRAEVDQTQNAFAKLSSSTTSVALGDDTGRATVDLALGIGSSEQKKLGVKDTGRIEIYIRNNTTGTSTLILQQELGELRYKNTRGEQDIKIGLQNGGVWRLSKNGSSMSTPPEAHYEAATLTLPLVVVDGPQQINSDEVIIKKNKTTFPTNHVEIEEEETVMMQIKSPYYQAWYEYFKNRLPGKLDAKMYHGNNTTEIILGFQNIFPRTFNEALLGTGSITTTNGNPTINGDIATTGSCNGCDDATTGTVTENYEFDGEQMNTIVQSRVNSLRANGTHINITSGETITSGQYYTDTFTPGGNVVFDVSDGDIVLAIDGNTYIENKVEIVGANQTGAGELVVYTTGDYSVTTGSGKVLVQSSNNTAHQIYGTSDTKFTVNQKATFEGLFYAPDTSGTSGSPGGGGGPGGAACGDVSVCIGQNTNVRGAIVAGSMEVGQGANVTYTTEFQDFNPKINLQEVFRPQVIYLHVSVNKVTVKEQSDSET